MSVPTPAVEHYRQALERCLGHLGGAEPLCAALRVVMEAVQAERGAFLAKLDDGSLAVRAAIGLPADLVVLCPVTCDERTIGVLGLGPRAGAREYGAEEHAFLRAAAACAAASLANVLLQ